MLLFRITQRDYANLDGSGGLLISSRWNEKGHRIVYLSENRALAVLEFLVHITSFDFSPADMALLTVDVPENCIEIDRKTLPDGWEKSYWVTRKIGTDFLIQKQFLLSSVPSVIVPVECNYLLNPQHALAAKCKITNSEPFDFDKRFLAKI